MRKNKRDIAAPDTRRQMKALMKAFDEMKGGSHSIAGIAIIRYGQMHSRVLRANGCVFYPWEDDSIEYSRDFMYRLDDDGY